MYIEDFIELRYKELNYELRSAITIEMINKLKENFAGLYGIVTFKKTKGIKSTHIAEDSKQLNTMIPIKYEKGNIKQYMEIDRYPLEDYGKYVVGNDVDCTGKYWHNITIYF